jgi:two-component system, cell cycle sensor histidine kinase and response regulator CckA
MTNPSSMNQELIEENALLKQRIQELELSDSERKQTEEALRESQAFYHSLVEQLPAGVFRKDREGRYVFVSPWFCRLKGLKEEEFLGKTPQEVAASEAAKLDTTGQVIKYAPQGEDHHVRIMQTGKAIELVEEYSDATGRKQFVHVIKIPVFTSEGKVIGTQGVLFDIKNPVFTSEGKVIGTQGVLFDITERKQAEDALVKSEEKFRLITENMSDCIALVDTNGTYQYVSPSFRETLGYDSEDLIGIKGFSLALPDDLERITRLYLEGIEQGRRETSFETMIRHKDGHYVPMEIRLRAVYDPQGTIMGGVLAARDITKRRQLEQERLHAEEEKRILEERLQHADKMEAVGTLAGGIAHDFNNLLMGIQGHASLTLLDLDPSHPHYERLKRIEEQVQSGADLTKQLLGFARGGRYEVKPANVNDIIKQSSSMFGRAKKEISIYRKYGKDLWSVEVDRGQMEQVFMNLYVNAWQAMPGGGEIYLETGNLLLSDAQAASYTVRPGKYVKISVTDTGTGMDEKTRERIFDPFFTTKGMGRGTGLGLATVYGIIKGHKGAIHVDSEPGHGTTFSIYLPASDREVIREETETGAIAKGTETILLVDDEKMVLEVNREMLESLGYRVYAAGSGQEGLSVYMEKRKEIDLVVLDMIMPGISGGETFDRLREIDPTVRVLLSSGYSINGEAKTIIDRGCNGFLQKPFQLEQLSGKVKETLG